MFALEGVKVLDITQVMAGAYCSMLLADMGADVIKIERPVTGDDTRRMGAVSDHRGDSPAFQAVNRNKRGLAVDLSDPLGVDIVRRLVKDADILIENFRPGTLDRLGIGYDDVRSINPAIVYCSISGFGATGPYAARGGFDLVAQGMSGLMSLTGEHGGAPVKVGVPLCDLNAGLLGAHGVLVAYIHRLRTGEGQYVDTSLFEAGIATTVWETALYTSEGAVAQRSGSAHRLVAPYEAFPVKDGWINIGAANERLWSVLCETIGLSELIHDDRFATAATRVEHRDELHDLIAEALSDRTGHEWFERLDAAGVPCGPILDIAQVYADPQAVAREMMVEIEHPRIGPTRHIGVPVKLSRTPGEVRRHAPILGEHTRQILAEAGLSPEQIETAIADGVVYDGLSQEVPA